MANHYRALPPDEVLLEDIAAGLRNTEIARKHNVNRQTVDTYFRTNHMRLDEAERERLKAEKKAADRRRSNLPDADGLREMVEAGLSNHDIAAQFGVATKTVEWHLRQHRISRGNKPTTIPTNEEIVACLKDGMSGLSIAKKFGCSVTPVLERIRKHDLRGEVAAKAEAYVPQPRPGIMVDRLLQISLPQVTMLLASPRYDGRAA